MKDEGVLDTLKTMERVSVHVFLRPSLYFMFALSIQIGLNTV